jgi:hypothetical protein
VSLRIDAQGKTFSHALLTMKVTVPEGLVKAAERGDKEDGSVKKPDAAATASPAKPRKSGVRSKEKKAAPRKGAARPAKSAGRSSARSRPKAPRKTVSRRARR